MAPVNSIILALRPSPALRLYGQDHILLPVVCW